MREPDEDSTGSTPVPFMIALGVIVLVVGGIGLSQLFEGDDVPEVDVVAQAAIAQNDALQRSDYADFRAYTCAAEAGEESDLLARQQNSVNTKGARYIDGVAGVSIDGEKATGTVIYHFDKAPDDKIESPTTFVREDGVWKVCSPGP
ncbi:Rv0361 family membrane protein [Mycolicibacterium mengxianglii]|uniref:Rv0361 family membrane protein n=1 Tax=Mycolicibacterium mengxianglii TaxID=2736649 RepID=UPI0018CFF3F0|nr:lumazine-binding protein [Mycolicibacterium mengxianglii]